MRKKIIIMGAAGRDFHNFNILYRDDASFEVVAFTAAQIPFIEKRTYPRELAGPLYPKGIPIYPEEDLARLIRRLAPDEAVFSYSDVPHDYVMHRASLCTALGVDFVLLGAEKTMLESKRPVISVCAVRTGCGKSGVTRFVARLVKSKGLRAVAIRHPMPYGELLKERVQRFESVKDIAAAGCTIEEMEEYEPLVASGITVFSGVDYKEILKAAELEADVIVWDGGNNDLPFIKPSLELVVVDPLRPGHELGYYPGEANLRRAHAVIINKVNSAKAGDIETVRANTRSLSPQAVIIETASVIEVAGDVDIKGKKVLVIEDGPTLTHGGMAFGAGIAAARMHGAIPVDVRPYAVGSIKETLLKYPHLQNCLPAMGYSKGQIRELQETIERTPCDAALVATPVNLHDALGIKRPCVRVSYEVRDIDGHGLKKAVEGFLKRLG